MTEHKPLTAEEITETAVGQWTYRVDGPHREEINTFVHRLAEDLRAARAAREAAERERDEALKAFTLGAVERDDLRTSRDRLAAECESLRAVVEKTQTRLATKTVVNLGDLIVALKESPRELPVTWGGTRLSSEVLSYRGYYNELAIEPNGGGATVGELLDALESSVGKLFEGYKGGQYRMDKQTPVWVSPYGMADDNLIYGVEIRDGEVVIKTAPAEAAEAARLAGKESPDAR